MKSPAELTDLFRARGLKVTPQRQCIFRTLHGNESHPTAETVFAAAQAEMPTISLKTVYQTLNDLAAMGEILQLDLGTGSARFDPNNDGAHHHLVCTECGKVRDVAPASPGIDLPGSHRKGFTVRSVEVTYRGLCDSCRRNRPSARPQSKGKTS